MPNCKLFAAAVIKGGAVVMICCIKRGISRGGILVFFWGEIFEYLSAQAHAASLNLALVWCFVALSGNAYLNLVPGETYQSSAG